MIERSSIQTLYTPTSAKPMNVVVFASGGGNNLHTAIAASQRDNLNIAIRAVVTDRIGIPAIEIAQAHSLPCITRDFREIDPLQTKQRDRYIREAEELHDTILEELESLETSLRETIDLIILSYRRIIRGKLLKRFEGKMINQHPGDLAVLSPSGRRRYIGTNPVYQALTDGITHTRTCCFLVREGTDTGEILCSGPRVRYGGHQPVTQESANDHEMIQKEKSDRPCLRFVLEAIAKGRFGIDGETEFRDGCKTITLDGNPLPYCGKELSNETP